MSQDAAGLKCSQAGSTIVTAEHAAPTRRATCPFCRGHESKSADFQGPPTVSPMRLEQNFWGVQSLRSGSLVWAFLCPAGPYGCWPCSRWRMLGFAWLRPSPCRQTGRQDQEPWALLGRCVPVSRPHLGRHSSRAGATDSATLSTSLYRSAVLRRLRPTATWVGGWPGCCWIVGRCGRCLWVGRT